MKKIIVLLFSGSMLLCACGGNEAPKQDENASTEMMMDSLESELQMDEVDSSVMELDNSTKNLDDLINNL